MKKLNLFKNLFKYNSEDYIYFGDNNFDISNNINFNYLIVGPCGSGKSLSFFTPNIMNQQNNSIVSLDLRKVLYDRCKDDLEKNGYKIFYLDSENFFDNIFTYSNIYKVLNNTYNDEEITCILDDFYEIKDEDDYYANIEITLLRAIAKKLILDKNEVILKDIFLNWMDLDFYHIEDYFKDYNDKYIKDNLDEFLIFTKDIGFNGLENFREKINSKFVKKEKDFSSFDFNILRKEKIAIFLETNNFSHNETYLSSFFSSFFNQIINNYEGNKINIFLDDFVCLRKFDKLKEVLALSRGRNYSLFLGIQHLEQLQSLDKSNYIDNILLFNNFVFFGGSLYDYENYKDILNILRIDFKPMRLDWMKKGECLFYYQKRNLQFGFSYIKNKSDILLKKINGK